MNTSQNAAVLRATHCFAVRDAHSTIDMVNPDTGKSCCYGETLEEIKLRYPGAELWNYDELMRIRADRQANEPREWIATTEEQYHEMMNCLPPAAMSGGAFLVGEPVDFDCATGRPRFSCYRKRGDDYRCLSVPISFREFNETFGPTTYSY